MKTKRSKTMGMYRELISRMKQAEAEATDPTLWREVVAVMQNLVARLNYYMLMVENGLGPEDVQDLDGY